MLYKSGNIEEANAKKAETANLKEKSKQLGKAFLILKMRYLKNWCKYQISHMSLYLLGLRGRQ